MDSVQIGWYKKYKRKREIFDLGDQSEVIVILQVSTREVVKNRLFQEIFFHLTS